MPPNLSWKRCALAILGLWVGLSGCSSSEDDEKTAPPLIVEDAGSDAGTPSDGGSTEEPGFPTEPAWDGEGYIGLTLPSQGAEAVPPNARVVVSFIEPLDESTVGADALAVTENGVPAEGDVGYDAPTRSLGFTPARPFAANALVKTSVSPTVRLSSSQALPAHFSFAFTSGASADTEPPVVVSARPASSSVVPSTYPVYLVSFTEPMDPQSLQGDTLQFHQQVGDGAATLLAGVIGYEPDTRSAYLRLAAPPTPGARITGTVSTRARDLAGNPLAATYGFTFTIDASADTTAPRVASTEPTTHSTGVSTHLPIITATFSEPIRPSTVTADTFFLEELSEDGVQVLGKVAGTVAYDDVRMRAVFTPSRPLNHPRRYRGTVRALVDLSGNAMTPYEGFDFVTAPPRIPPLVVSTTPARDARFVSTASVLRVSFDRALDPATLTEETFQVSGATGLLNYEASTRTAVFRPVPELEAGRTYAVTLKDLRTPENGVLAEPYTFSFRTVGAKVRLNGALPGQTVDVASATGPAGTLVVWNERTGLSTQVRAAFDPGTGFQDSFFVSENSGPRPPRVTVVGNTFAINWDESSFNLDSLYLFDGTSLTRDDAPAIGPMFSLAGRLYHYYPQSKQLQVRVGPRDWDFVASPAQLGSPVSILPNQNGDRVLLTSGQGTTSKAVAFFDGVKVVQTTFTSSREVDYISVGNSFARAWVSTRGTEYSLFNLTTGQWGTAELITSTQATRVRLATDGSAVTVVYGTSAGLFASHRNANGTWQAAVTLDARPVVELQGLVRHRNNYLALWSTVASELLATSQVGGVWSSGQSVPVASGVSRVSSLQVSGDDLLVLSEKDTSASAYETWGTALTPQGWRPSVKLRDAATSPARFTRLGAASAVAFTGQGQVDVRTYLGNGQWEAARPLAAPALVGSVRSSSVTFEPDGRGAAVWEQFEAGEWNVFLSEFDGALWDEPVRIARNAWRPRVAIDSSRAVIGFQRPGAPGKLDYWTVAYEAGAVGTPIRHGDTNMVDIPPPEFVLSHGAGGFMVLWGITELRSSQSTNGQTWSEPVTALPGPSPWTNTRLMSLGGSFVMASQRTSDDLMATRVSTGGIWQSMGQSGAFYGTSFELATDGTTAMVVVGSEDEFHSSFYDGATWSRGVTVSAPRDARALVAHSPQGYRMHTGSHWWKWNGATWVRDVLSSRPNLQGLLRCEETGCGIASTPSYPDLSGLTLSHAIGTGPFQSGGFTLSPGRLSDVTWNYSAGSYRLTWQQEASEQARGTVSVYAMTDL